MGTGVDEQRRPPAVGHRLAHGRAKQIAIDDRARVDHDDDFRVRHAREHARPANDAQGERAALAQSLHPREIRKPRPLEVAMMNAGVRRDERGALIQVHPGERSAGGVGNDQCGNWQHGVISGATHSNRRAKTAGQR